MWCWGYNQYNLGDGTTQNRNAPVMTQGINGAVDAALGFYHTCVLSTGGTVRCWGMNSNGQVGDGTTITRVQPVEVMEVRGASVMSSAFVHTCAVMNNGVLYCWGLNARGQLGDGTTTNRSRPTPVIGLGTGSDAGC